MQQLLFRIWFNTILNVSWKSLPSGPVANPFGTKKSAGLDPSFKITFAKFFLSIESAIASRNFWLFNGVSCPPRFGSYVRRMYLLVSMCQTLLYYFYTYQRILLIEVQNQLHLYHINLLL